MVHLSHLSTTWLTSWLPRKTFKSIYFIYSKNEHLGQISKLGTLLITSGLY
jgi:hypothetical protein